MSETAVRRAPAPQSNDFPKIPVSGWAAPWVGTFIRPRSGGGLVRQVQYVLIDLVMLCLGSATVYWLRFGVPHIGVGFGSEAGKQVRFLLIHGYGGFLVLYAALVVLACVSQDLYRTPRELDSLTETVAVSKAIGLATAVLVLFVFTSGNKEISRLVVTCSGLLNIITFSGWRYAKRRYVSHRLSQGIGTRRALIVGAGKSGRELAACFEQNRELGYRVCGFLDAHPNGDSRVMGSISDLRRVALAEFADEVFVTSPADREMVKQIFVEARNLRLDLHVVPELYDGLGRNAPIRVIGGFPALLIHGQPIPAFGLAVKRLIDVFFSAVALVLAMPILMAAAIWIRLDSPGPILYPAYRVGKKGRHFHCYKLRTMVMTADAEKEKLRQCNGRSGPFFKMDNDPRVTRSGHWLRKYSIDELPQLTNVLLGDMSLVGPRPHPVDDVERYGFEDLRRLEVKPGLTGLWQTEARLNPKFETSMALDLEYIEKWGLLLDFQILIKTLPVVLKGQGQ